MKEKLIEAANEMWGESYTDFKEMCGELSPSEILDAWLSYEGISGYKLDTPISVGACYPQGSNYVSWYKVLSMDDDTAILCRPKDGWTLVAHNPALYETPHGQQLMWDYSTGGHFEENNREGS